MNASCVSSILPGAMNMAATSQAKSCCCVCVCPVLITAMKYLRQSTYTVKTGLFSSQFWKLSVQIASSRLCGEGWRWISWSHDQDDDGGKVCESKQLHLEPKSRRRIGGPILFAVLVANLRELQELYINFLMPRWPQDLSWSSRPSFNHNAHSKTSRSYLRHFRNVYTHMHVYVHVYKDVHRW